MTEYATNDTPDGTYIEEVPPQLLSGYVHGEFLSRVGDTI